MFYRITLMFANQRESHQNHSFPATRITGIFNFHIKIDKNYYLPFDKYLKMKKKYFLPYDNRGNKSQMNWTYNCTLKYIKIF